MVYESGVAANVPYGVEPGSKRAVGFKQFEGLDPPDWLAAFKWARQKSALAGAIRGTSFVIKGQY